MPTRAVLRWLRRLGSRSSASLSKRSTGRKRDRLACLLNVTQLETRRVLNADGFVGELFVDAGEQANDGQQDFFEINVLDDQVDVHVNGRQIGSTALDQISNIRLQGSSDNDHVQVNYLGQQPAGLDLSIDTGSGDDLLRLVSTDKLDSLVYAITGNENATIQLNSSASTDPQGISRDLASSIQLHNVEQIQQDLNTESMLVNLDRSELDVRLTTLGELGSQHELRIGETLSESFDQNPSISIEFKSSSSDFTIDTTSDAQDAGRNNVTIVGEGMWSGSGFHILGDTRDHFVFEGVQHFDGNDVSISTGVINWNGELVSQAASIDLQASQSINFSQNSGVFNSLGSVNVSAQEIIFQGTIISEGGNVKLDSGASGTTLVYGSINVDHFADSMVGGRIEVLGERVGILDTAILSASGFAGGGTILVGGDYQGGNDTIHNADRTFVSFNAAIFADAIEHGNGGTVIVWADQWTRYYGHISARGGQQSGDGGFVEVSGKQSLDFAGRVNLQAENGEQGSLLLDPLDVNIVNGGADGGEIADSEVLFADSPGSTFNIQASSITDVVGLIVIQATNDIVVDEAISLATASLALQAGNDLTINSSIDVGGDLFLEADSVHDSPDGSGTLTITGAISVTSTTGEIHLIAPNFSFTGGATVGSGTTNVYLSKPQGGTLDIGSDIDISSLAAFATAGTVTLGQATTGGDDSSFTNQQTITVDTVNFGSAATFAAADAGQISVIANDGVIIDATLTTNQNLTINADADADETGTLTANNNKDIVTNGFDLAVTAADVDLVNQATIDASTGNVSFTSTNSSGVELGTTSLTRFNLNVGELSDITANDLTVTTDQTIIVDGVTAASSNAIAGDFILVANGASSTVTFSGTDSTFNALQVLASDGVTVTAGLTTATGGISIDADTDVGDGVGTFEVSGLTGKVDTGGQNLSVTADDITLATSLLVGRIDTGAGSVTLIDSDGSGIAFGSTTVATDFELTDAEYQEITAQQLTLQTSGNLIFDAVAANANVDEVQLIADGGSSTISSGSNSSSFAIFSLSSTDGITINGDVTTSGTITVDSDSDDDGSGTFTIASSVAVDSTNQAISIVAADVDFTGTLNSGTASISITESVSDGIQIGGSSGSTGLVIFASELDNLTATGLNLATDANVTIAAIDASESDQIAGLVDITTTAAATINAVATFNALRIRSNDGITVNANLATAVGDLTLDADFDNATSGGLQFAAGVQLDSAGAIQLDATTGLVTAAGSLTVSADNGISLSDSLTSAGTLTFNSDDDADGTGTLTIGTGVTLSSTNQTIGLTAADLVLDGSVDSGTASTTLQSTSNLGLGATSVTGMNVTQSELDAVTSNGLTAQASGQLVVDGVTQPVNVSGSVTLIASGTSPSIQFQNSASSFLALSLQADDGITIAANVTTTAGVLSINADADGNDNNGTLSIGAGATLTSTNHAIQVTANDIAISGAISSGTASTTITDSDGNGIGMGTQTVANGLNLNQTDLDAITASELFLTSAGGISVGGVTAPAGLSGTTHLDAAGTIRFESAASTFQSLDAASDDLIVVEQNLSTTVGGITLDGDSNGLVDTNDQIQFASGVALNAATTLTLDASNGNLTSAGALSLTANDGISLNDALAANGTLTINADADANDGIGTLTIAGGITSSNDDVLVSADDISLTGGIDVGTGAISIQATGTASIALGSASVASGIQLTDAELAGLVADDLTIQAPAEIRVAAVSSLTQIANAVNLIGSGTTSQIIFETTASSFQALNATATDGITVNTNVDTLVGGITLTSDSDGDEIGSVTVASGVSLTSADSVQITAEDIVLSGNIVSTSQVTLTDSGGGTAGFGIGDTTIVGGVNLSTGELQRISSTDLLITTSGNVEVDNVSASNSNNVSGLATIQSGGQVTIAATGAVFNALSIDADAGIVVNGNLTTDSGNLSLDGDADTSDDGVGVDRITFAAGIQISSAGNLTLDADGDKMIGSGTLTLNAADGITINDDLTTSGAISFNADTDAGDQTGTLTVVASATVDSTNNSVQITADDIALLGNLTVGTGSLTIVDSDGDGIGLGDAVTAGINLSGADLQGLAATNLTLSTSGNIEVDNVTAANSANITGVIQLNSGSTTTFSSTSVFNSISVNSDNGVIVQGNLTADTGSVSIDADANNSADGNDQIQLSSGAQINAVSTISLAATNGGITGAGTLSLNAGDGIQIQDAISSTGAMTFDADTNDDGIGVLQALSTITSTNANIDVTTSDIDFQGNVSAGTGEIFIRDSVASGISLGDNPMAGAISLGDSELQLLTANGLTLQTQGDITVDNVTPPVSISGTVALIANGAGSTISFQNGASSFDGLSISASDGVSVGADLTTTGSLTINADTDSPDGIGTFSVAAGVTVNTTNQDLSVTANDLDLQGNINVGSGDTLLIDSDGTGIGLGSTAVGFDISQTELQRISTNDLELQTSGGITVDNISAANSNAVSGTLLLNADGAITFTANGATFNALTAQGNGVVVAGVLATDVGDLSLDGDKNNAGGDDLVFAAGASVSSAGSLTVAATSGDITSPGALTLQAADGINIEDDLITNGTLLLNADTDSDIDDGQLTLASGASVVTNNGTLTIIASDLDIQGSFDSGTASTTIQNSEGDGIGLGTATVAGGMNLSNVDLQDFTATDFTISTTGDIVVDGFTQAGTIAGTTTLDGDNVTFSGNASSFETLLVQADDRIEVNANVTTVTGSLELIADANLSSDTNDDILFAADTQLTSAGQLTLQATTGDITGAGALTLLSADGMTIKDSLTTLGALVIDADTDNGGLGTLTVDAGVTVSSTNQSISLTVGDMSIAGGIDAGTATITIEDSDGAGIGLGNATIVGGLNLTVADFQDFTAGGLVLTTAGNIEVDGMSQPATLGGTTQLNASGAGSTVTFSGTASSFNTLSIDANDGVSIQANLSSTVGDLTINSDVDAGDNNGTLTINAGVVVSTPNQQLQITANDMDLQGTLSSGTAETTIGVSDSSAIALGNAVAVNGLTLDTLEMTRITSGDLTFQASDNIIVDGVNQPGTVQGTTNLQSGGTVQFTTTASVFTALNVEADDQVDVAADVTTTGGDIILDGDADNSGGTATSILFAAGSTLTSSNAITLNSSTGGATAVGQLDLLANTDITLNTDLVANGIVSLNADNDANGSGTVTVSGAGSISSTNQQINITANDLALSGAVSAGTSTVQISDSDGSGIGLGSAIVSGGISLSNIDVGNVSAGTLLISTQGNISVDGFTQPSSITGDVQLQATGGSSTIAFSGSDTTFEEVTMTAADGVSLAANVTVLSGDVTIQADSDAGDGTGTFSIASGFTLDSSNHNVSVTANDIDLQGTINAGTGSITLIDSDDSGIRISNSGATGVLSVSEAELNSVVTSNLTFSTGGQILVSDVTQNTATADLTQLIAGSNVVFGTDTSTFNSLNVQADNGIGLFVGVMTSEGDLSLDGDANNSADGNDTVLFFSGVQVSSAGDLTLDATSAEIRVNGTATLQADEDLTINDALTSTGTLNLYADADADSSGTLSVAAAASIDTNNNALTLMANDLSIAGTVSSGTATTTISDSDAGGIGLGNATIVGGLNIDNSELDKFTAGAMLFSSNGNIELDGPVQPATVSGSLDLEAAGSISFLNTTPTWSAIDAKADSGINVNVNLTTSSGALDLDADADDSGSGQLNLAFGVQLSSASTISLDGASIQGSGGSALNAADGITISADYSTGGTLTIDADTDFGDQTGTLNVSTGASITTGNQQLSITAEDINLSGTLDTGTAQLTIADSDGSGIGLGNTIVGNGLNISGSELQNIQAGQLNLSTTGDLYVNGISSTNSAGVSGDVVLQSGSQVNFSGSDSTFGSLDAQANDGINVNTTVITNVGDLRLDGDANNAVDSSDSILFASGINLTSASQLSLQADQGSLVGSGALNLFAADGIQVESDLSTSGVLTINADTDANDGVGTLSVNGGSTITTNNNALNITAEDVSFSGSLNSGTATITITESEGDGIGFGSTTVAGGLNFTNGDLAGFTSGGLTLTTSGDFVVDGVVQPGNITGLVTLSDSGSSSDVSFANSGSTFGQLAVNIGGNISVAADVQSTSGDLQFTSTGSLSVANGVQIVGAGNATDLTIAASNVTLGNGSSGSESLYNPNTGNISITTTSGAVDVDDFAIASDSGTIYINAVGGITESSNNDTVKIATSGFMTLYAGNSVGSTAGANLAGTGAIDIQATVLTSSLYSTGGLFLRIDNAVNVLGLQTTNGSIEVLSTDVMNMLSPVTAGGVGDITLIASTLSFIDSGDVTTNSGSINASATTNGGLLITDGAVFTTDQGSISGQFVNANNPFDGSSDTGDPLTDSNRIAQINLVIADPYATGIGIEIDWQEGNPTGPEFSAAPGDPRTQIVQSTISSGSSGTVYAHNYENAPDPTDPSADINVELRITEIAGGSINLFDAGTSVFDVTINTPQSLVLVVSSPILPFFVALPASDIPDAIVQPTSVAVQVAERQRLFTTQAPQVLTGSIGTARQLEQRYYVLRIVTFGSEGEIKIIRDNQEFRLPDLEDSDSDSGFEISQLPELFKRLPDDRYRIYMIEGQTERLVLDFIIQDGQPIEAQHTDNATSYRQTSEGDVTDSENQLDVSKTHSPTTRIDGPHTDTQSDQSSLMERFGRAPLVAAGGMILTAEMMRFTKRDTASSRQIPIQNQRPTKRDQATHVGASR
ncbi:hypothetical protein LOC67_23060 [Stieleria sp. JC731]|uniref:beta strand repeat-containing protein n=1 Tax=Pirellulaceae TaxID=2691357 RepID=UPI001E45ABE0|nr:hypothetical protein [Stieleria sp. JC731]MCC9603439.1 hypothetical protein [Stieleria sp. JC731]